ncbi:MAG TPA: MBL fold metallo-hydrolase [Candidatus Methylomirabilis sp.]|nr:MBL fold metallo-hydrolase [Candidatus Methylomirabilis sp.]
MSGRTLEGQSARRPASIAAVDRLDVLVLVDNVTDQLSSNPGDVQSEFANLMKSGLRTISGEAICCAQHGLSLLITAHRAGTSHTVLFDTGPEGYAIERNSRLLGVDFGAVESLVLSHGHWDHCGGALTALRLARDGRHRPAVAVYTHPGMFRRRARRLPGGDVVPFNAIATAAEMTGTGAAVVVTPEPRLLHGDHFYVSGEIPRVTGYERGLADHLWQPEKHAAWEPDPLILDERFLAAHVEGKGLVVVTGCSHAGVVNVLTQARALFPDVPLFSVMGGLHLSGAGPEKVIGDTVADLARFGLRRIAPGHCTGWRAVTALVNAFGETAVTPLAVGKRFSF